MSLKTLFVCILFGSALLSACAALATPIQERTPVPLLTEPVVEAGGRDFYPLTTRTGIEDIDIILAAVEIGDPQALRDLFRFTSTACTTAEGLGGPPKCRDGESDGTHVEVLPFLGPEGSFLRRDEIGNFPGLNVTGLYAVYRVSENAYSEVEYPAGEYGVALVAQESSPNIILQVLNGGIVRIDYVFGPSLEDLKAVLDRDASGIVISP